MVYLLVNLCVAGDLLGLSIEVLSATITNRTKDDGCTEYSVIIIKNISLLNIGLIDGSEIIYYLMIIDG